MVRGMTTTTNPLADLSKATPTDNREGHSERAHLYSHADAAGDLPCVDASGIPAADLERYAAAGADVLAEAERAS